MRNLHKLTQRAWFALLHRPRRYVNVVHPMLEITMVENDNLLAPHFGASGLGNFLGWQNAKLRGVRLITQMLLLNAYTWGCNVNLYKLRRQFKFTVKSSNGVQQVTNRKILEKLTRQQVRLTFCIAVSVAFYVLLLVSPGAFGVHRLVVPPCSFMGGLFADMAVYVRLMCSFFCGLLLADTDKKRASSKVATSPTSSGASALVRSSEASEALSTCG